MKLLLSVTAVLIGLSALAPSGALGDYRPLWVLADRFDYTFECTNMGLRTYTYNDTQQVHTLAVTINDLYNRSPEYEGPEVAVGDSILVLARGNFLRDDRARYILFLIHQTRRDYPGLPLPLFEGKAVPCNEFKTMFTRERADCPSSRTPGADLCACVREGVYRYQELLAAREAGNEIEFLRTQLADENTIIVASALGLLRIAREPSTAEWLWPLLDHPEYQVRYDLAETLQYLGGKAAGQIGIRLLSDQNEEIQILAAYSLGVMRYDTAELALADILEDPERNRMVRASCLAALQKMDSELLLPALERAVAAETDSVAGRGFRKHLEMQRAKSASRD